MNTRPPGKKLTLAICTIAAVFGLTGCATSGSTTESAPAVSVSAEDIARRDVFIAEEFIRRGFTDPAMSPRVTDTTTAVWTYGLGTCRLKATIDSGTDNQATWDKIRDAEYTLLKSRYARCKATAE